MTAAKPVLEWLGGPMSDGDHAWGTWWVDVASLRMFVDGYKRARLESGYEWTVGDGRSKRRGTAPTLLEAQLAAERCAREWLLEGLRVLTPGRKERARASMRELGGEDAFIGGVLAVGEGGMRCGADFDDGVMCTTCHLPTGHKGEHR